MDDLTRLKTETAYQLFLNKELTESDIVSFIESQEISGQYLLEIHEKQEKEHILKRIAKHPVTKVGAVGAAVAGAGVAGLKHGIKQGINIGNAEAYLKVAENPHIAIHLAGANKVAGALADHGKEKALGAWDDAVNAGKSLLGLN